MHFVKNDGGRADAGFKGSTGDCGIRAAAIVLDKPYKEVYDALQEIQTAFNAKKRNLKPSHRYVRNGVWKEVMHTYVTSFGAEWVPLASIGGEVVRVHDVAERWPNHRIVMRLARHFSAMVGGVNLDTWAQIPVKRVYGIWIIPT